MRKRDIASRLPVRIGLSEAEAAVFIGVSPSHFQKLKRKSLVPQPRDIDGVKAYDVEELVIAYRSFPREGSDPVNDTWADFG
jgi:hypothetical protein